MILLEYIEKIEDTIKNNNQNEAEKLYDKVIAIFKNDIKDLEEGTSNLRAKMNMIYQLNFDEKKDYLDTSVDYIDDLKIILIKLKKYNEEHSRTNIVNNYNAPITNNNNYGIVNESNININNSNISKSNIGCKNSKEKKNIWKIIAAIIGVIAGIATIISTIYGILHGVGII